MPGAPFGATQGAVLNMGTCLAYAAVPLFSLSPRERAGVREHLAPEFPHLYPLPGGEE